MGFLRNNRLDVSRTDTQIFDGRLSPPPFSGLGYIGDGEDTDKISYARRTVQFHDTIPVDEEFETQVVNLAGETQAFNIAGETQILSLGGETQILGDPDCSGGLDFNTQILNDFDDEVDSDSHDDGSERTEIMVGDDLSDDESRRSFDQPVESEKSRFTSPCEHDRKGLEELPNNLTDTKYNTGAMRFTSIRAASLRSSGLAARKFAFQSRVPGSFASVRAASLRSSGLAARKFALQSIDPGSSAVVSDNENIEQFYLKNNHVDCQANLGQFSENVRELGNTTCRVGSSAVRKLFTEDLTPVGDVGSLHTSYDVGGIGPLSTACHDQLGGLSYIDSQEPEDSLQAHALDFVDKFLEDNAMEFDQGGSHEKDPMVQSKSVTNSKEQYNLANVVNCIRTMGESRIFDWDDNREDEGGGDIFCRRKEEFFDCRDSGRISLSQPQKLKRRKSDSYGDKGGFLSIQHTKSRPFFSDSNLELSKEKQNNESAQKANVKYQNSLSNKLDQLTNSHTSREELEDNDIADEQEVSNVGFDTQMAAEAMEVLCHSENIAKFVNNEANQHLQNSSKDSFRGPRTGKLDNSVNSRKYLSSKSGCASNAGYTKSKERKTVYTKKNGQSVLSQNSSENLTKQYKNKIVKRSKKGKKDADEIMGNEYMNHIPIDGGSTIQKRLLRREVVESAAVAHRTRHSMMTNQLEKTKTASGDFEKLNSSTEVEPLNKKISRGQASRRGPKAKETTAPEAVSSLHVELKIEKPIGPKILNTKSSKGIKNDAMSSVGEQSSHGILSGQPSLSGNLPGPTVERRKRSCNVRKTRSSVRSFSPFSLHENLERPTVDQTNTENAQFGCISAQVNDKMSNKDSNGTTAVQKLKKKRDGCRVASVKKTTSEESPRKRCKPSDAVCITPPENCKTPVNAASPVCMGNEYYKQSCKNNLSKSCLLKELRSLSAVGLVPGSLSSESRKRKDMSCVRVLYSQHLDEDIVKQQKKTLARLGVTLASSMTDATHFIADKFVRTRNMLEAIALGKLVVTHLWIDSCGQASCFIDEKNYILRDTKKEKEFGFSMPASLACARQHPLLRGRRVLITQNTKPGKDIISTLVKAVMGQAVERIGRSVLKDDQIPDDLLVLSCEEDYDICLPFLEKGAAVYSSELLLNGIVTQKLEFERHRLFVDHVKRTRSTIWLKKDGAKFHPVTKH